MKNYRPKMRTTDLVCRSLPEHHTERYAGARHVRHFWGHTWTWNNAQKYKNGEECNNKNINKRRRVPCMNGTKGPHMQVGSREQGAERKQSRLSQTSEPRMYSTSQMTHVSLLDSRTEHITNLSSTTISYICQWRLKPHRHAAGGGDDRTLGGGEVGGKRLADDVHRASSTDRGIEQIAESHGSTPLQLKATGA